MQVIARGRAHRRTRLRQALRMTNESFAEHLGVAVRTVAYWRNRPDMIPQRANCKKCSTPRWIGPLTG